MTERVDICNMALSWIGAQTINSVDDDSNEARVCKISYTAARDATLEAHDWTFAMTRFTPALLSEDPVYGASNAFDVPPEIIRVISVDRESESDPAWGGYINQREQIDWQFENGTIICREDVIYARGIRRIEQEGRFSPLFVQAFAAKLAYMISIPLSASTEIRQAMERQYEVAIHEAASRDGLQGRNKRIRNRVFLKSR